MKKTIIKISTTFIEDFLQLPINVKIENVSKNITKNNEIMVLLEGEGLPDFTKVKEGERISMSKIIRTRIISEIKKAG